MSNASNLAGFVTSISPINNLNVGVVTATRFDGKLGNISGGFAGIATTSQSGTTTIDLSQGSIIYFTHNTDTTVAFANTSTTQQLTFIRTKDNSFTTRSITWPSNVYWDNVDTPTLQNEGATRNVQTFSLTTRDGGVSWVGYQVQRNAGIGTYMYVWGSNNVGQSAQNTTASYTVSKLFENTTSWSDVFGGKFSGYPFALALKTNGTLWGWGSNNYGALGQNNVTQYSSPIQISGTNWAFGAASEIHSLAIKTDNTLWATGHNANSQLGLNDVANRSSPVQIPGTNWKYVANGQRYSNAIKTDNTLWSWGSNSYGQLGQSNLTVYSSPIQIPGTNWSNIVCTSYSSLAAKSDNTLWAWGRAATGRLGQNTTTQYSSPVQIPGTNWSSTVIECNVNTAYALKTDNTLWAWGTGSSGELGNNSIVSTSSPTQIPGTNWSSLQGGGSFIIAKKTDNTLWSWGSNGNGELVAPPSSGFSSPVQIPGTNWAYASATNTAVFAFKNVS